MEHAMHMQDLQTACRQLRQPISKKTSHYEGFPAKAPSQTGHCPWNRSSGSTETGMLRFEDPKRGISYRPTTQSRALKEAKNETSSLSSGLFHGKRMFIDFLSLQKNRKENKQEHESGARLAKKKSGLLSWCRRGSFPLSVLLRFVPRSSLRFSFCLKRMARVKKKEQESRAISFPPFFSTLAFSLSHCT